MTHESNQKAYWDKLANTKTFTHQIDYKKWGEYVSRNALILDYGCGYGRVLKSLCDNGYTNVCGVDFSTEMIKRAQNELPGIKFFQNENNHIKNVSPNITVMEFLNSKMVVL